MFKHANTFDYNVKGSRSENCILIDSKNWLINNSNAIIGINSRGGIANTYITEVLAANIPEDSKYTKLNLKAGDIVLLTAVSTRVYCHRTFTLPIDGDNTKYTDIPVSHIIGRFEKGTISLSSLSLFRSYVVLTPVEDVEKEGDLTVTSTVNRNVFKVEKVGPDVKSVKVGDVVLTRDNIVTDIMIYSKQYGVTTEDMIVGKFDGAYDIDKLIPLNKYIVMKDHKSDFAEGSGNILNPHYDVFTDVEQISEVYNEDRFEVIVSDEPSIKTGDILDIPREATSYATLKGTRYYVNSGLTFINARIGE